MRKIRKNEVLKEMFFLFLFFLSSLSQKGRKEYKRKNGKARKKGKKRAYLYILLPSPLYFLSSSFPLSLLLLIFILSALTAYLLSFPACLHVPPLHSPSFLLLLLFFPLSSYFLLIIINSLLAYLFLLFILPPLHFPSSYFFTLMIPCLAYLFLLLSIPFPLYPSSLLHSFSKKIKKDRSKVYKWRKKRVELKMQVKVRGRKVLKWGRGRVGRRKGRKGRGREKEDWIPLEAKCSNLLILSPTLPSTLPPLSCKINELD
jgi:hypothetical protein